MYSVHITNRAEDAPIMEAKDIYLDIIITGMLIKSTIIPTDGDIAINAPIPVAVPFPPLKLRNTDQLCPIKTAIADPTSSNKDSSKL